MLKFATQHRTLVMNHEIVITNFKQNDIVTYPLIIIKGELKHWKTYKCSSTSDVIQINTNSAKLVDNRFKTIVELAEGANTITLKYCCISANIEISYSPRTSKYTVLPLYVVCDGHTGKFQSPATEKNYAESARQRITLGAKLLQSVIAEKLYDEEFGRKTFRLEQECQIFYSKLHYLKAREMGQEELWECLGREIVEAELGHEKTKFMAFLGCTKYCGGRYEEGFDHDDIVRITQAHVALGGGGLALFGTGCLYTWPEKLSHVVEKFNDATLVDRFKFMDDSCYRGTLGACFSTTLGAVLHELCHTFDLGHTENGIMGRGFDDIYKVFINTNQPQKHTSFGTVFKTLNNQNDDTFWTKSCLVFLAYHKWLNNFDNLDSKMIKFDLSNNLLTSTLGLRVVELRNEITGLVLSSWVFCGRVLKYSFQLPEDALKCQTEKTVLLCVEDNNGNILKRVVNM